MISFPNSKINLGLHVTGRRQDGYHDIETVFYPLPLFDVLEIIHDSSYSTISPQHQNGADFSTSGLPINGAADKNLCVKAYQLIKRDFPKLPPVHIYLHKAIPIGAGLGGGSADGAFTLQLLDAKFQLKLTTDQLLKYAIQLGSDCPFFIVNRPCFATGRGELLQAVDLNLENYSFVVVNPGIHISTSWAFQQLTPAKPRISIKEAILRPVPEWKDMLTNDFEEAILEHHPELSSVKVSIYKSGAIYASLSGSGSCYYGIYPKRSVPNLSFPDHFQILHIK